MQATRGRWWRRRDGSLKPWAALAASMDWAVLDTSLLLGGREPPPDHRLATTPEAEAEVSPGGRDARRFAMWQAKGLQVRAAEAPDTAAVRSAAQGAGNLGRLSAADVSLLALARGLDAVLVTDDHTMLDVARRLGLRTHSFTKGIRGTMDWRPRCSGCGRWLEAPATACPVCGSPVRLRPVPDGARSG